MSSPAAFRKYQIVQRLASGGMAEIFLAKVQGEGGFSRSCVIKKMHPYLMARPGSMQVFLGEARLAARLLHPGIAQILDVGREGDDFFIVLEHLDGHDLAAVLWRCSQKKIIIPIDLALKIAAFAAEALHYAHELKDEHGQPMNIVHCDVSPSNLFLTFQGTVKLLDFGIAQASSRLDETAQEKIKGKLAYMAPEQTYGHGDRRVDVWALGVCLHEMLTGERLFVGADWNGTLQAVREARIPRPSESRPDVPEEVDALVMHALERDPEKRLPTAAAFGARLEGALRNRSYISPAAQTGAFLSHLFEGEARQTTETSGPSRTLDIVTLGTHEIGGSVAPSELTELLSVDSNPVAGNSWKRKTVIALIAMSLVASVALFLRTRELSRSAAVPALQEQVPSIIPIPSNIPPPSAGTPSPTPIEKPPAPTPVETAPAPPPTRVARNETNPRTTPPPAIGWLTLTSSRTLDVFLDDVPLGTTPLRRARVNAGTHKLKLEAGGMSRVMKIFVRAGDSVSRHEVIRDSMLNVSVDPWADVYLDGVKLGQTPLVRSVWDGEHQLKLVGPRGATKTMKVVLSADRPLVIDEKL